MKILSAIVDENDAVNKKYVDDAVNAKATLTVQTAASAGEVTNAEVTNGDNRLKFERAGDVMQMDIDDGNVQNTAFLACQSYVDGLSGNLSALATTDKTNLVAAINEVNTKAGTHFQVGVERWYGTYTDENGVTYQTYSKVVYIPALPSTPGITTYPIGVSGMKQIIGISGVTTDGFVLNAPRQTVTDNITIYQTSKGSQTFSIEVGKNRSNKSAYVTIIYAKNN